MADEESLRARIAQFEAEAAALRRENVSLRLRLRVKKKPTSPLVAAALRSVHESSGQPSRGPHKGTRYARRHS